MLRAALMCQESEIRIYISNFEFRMISNCEFVLRRVASMNYGARCRQAVCSLLERAGDTATTSNTDEVIKHEPDLYSRSRMP